MTINIGITELSVGVIIIGLLQLWISECLKASLQRENTKFVEKIRWDIKVREQAERVAEYMSIARNLKETDPPDIYQRANRLNWELAMWLPEDLYNAMMSAIAKPSDKINPLSVVIDIRKYLLGNSAGNLSQNNVGHHAPGIGEIAANHPLQQTEAHGAGSGSRARR